MQHQREVRQRVRRAGLNFQRRGNEAVRLAGLAALMVEHAEQMQRVEIVALRLEHARVELFRMVQAALPVQRQCLADRLAGIKRAGTRAHSRLIRAIRRVTSTGVALSAVVLSASA